MKKLLAFSSFKILMTGLIALASTLGAFWHYQINQAQLDRMNLLNQGIGTCFNRISQSFTAIMIKDINSPYLNRGFMALSDECLGETVKGINPFKHYVGKGYQSLNKLISDAHWFHESILRTHAPIVGAKQVSAPLNSLSSKFSEMETLKLNLIDEVDGTIERIKDVQRSDEILMGLGLLFFVLSFSLLTIKEVNLIQQKKDVENKALNLLRSGQTNVSGPVDDLVSQALKICALPISAQIFRDYHQEILMSHSGNRSYHEIPVNNRSGRKIQEVQEDEDQQTDTSVVNDHFQLDVSKCSFQEVLVSIQNIHGKDVISSSDVRDVLMAIDNEVFEQMMNAAINKMKSKMTDHKKVAISNQVHSDRVVINLFMSGATFSAEELEFAESKNSVNTDAVDLNMVILKEMAAETQTQWSMQNKSDRQGKITGTVIRFTIKRTLKESKSNKNLVSVMRGKKKDLARNLMN